MITRLNRIRRENPALWRFTNLEFQNAWNDNILVYAKMTGQVDSRGRIVSTPDNAILVAVNLDPRTAQGCNFEVPLWRFGLSDNASIAVEDLLDRAPLRLDRQDAARLARPAPQPLRRSGG